MSVPELEYPLFVIAILANISLVLIVLRYTSKSQNRMMFVLFGLSQTIWILVNYFAIRSSPENILDMARWTITTAVPHPLLFFLFIHSFLRKEEVLKQKHAVWALFWVLLLMFVARSPYLFTHVETRNGELTPIAGPGMAIFGIYAFIFIILSFIRIYKSWRRSQGIEKRQWQFVGIGLLLTFMLVLSLNFILAVVVEDTTYINFGHLYTLPFIVFTAYAMIKHHLLNIKTIAAELAVILLNLIMIIQLVSSQSVGQFITNALVLCGTLVVGILLIRGVMKEIRQREQLQILTNKLKEANKQLKVLDQARAEFITMASHQLRTPPSGIKWYLSAILADEFGQVSGELREALEKVNLTNNSLVSLVDALLNVSRIERGELEFVFEETDLTAITELTVDQLRPLALQKNLTLTFEKPETLVPKLIIDKEKVRQVINNMIDNAIKYSRQGRIEVSIETTNKDVILKVKDTGKGMTAEEQKIAFEKYGRGKNSTKYSTGLGLGMYLGKVIVEQHGGKIWAESAGPNTGSTFAFSIPRDSKIKPTSLIFDLTKTQTVK